MDRKRGRRFTARDHATVAERFWAKVDKDAPNGCWEWLGARDTYGYGYLGIAGKSERVHCLAYKWLVGPIPEGKELDHLCRNPPCINTAHLEPVTHRENLRRGNSPAGKRARQTHCIHGHELTEANIYRRKNGTRRCRTCTIAENRAYRQRAARA